MQSHLLEMGLAIFLTVPYFGPLDVAILCLVVNVDGKHLTVDHACRTVCDRAATRVLGPY